MATLLASGLDLTIGEREFQIFRKLVYAHTGISLSPYKRYLLQARLARRLRALGLTTFVEYRRHLVENDADGQELTRFINAITTNKTGFFREPHHFRHLAEDWAPARAARGPRAGDWKVRVWSAGCSSGEEAYSLAMTLIEAFGPIGWDLRLLASDIDTDVLARAARGVYGVEQVAPVPAALLARHFVQGTGVDAGSVRVRPALRSRVAFRRINLLDDPWPIRTRFDAIFCRNVLIYFDRATQARVLERLAGLLREDGLLVLGHSESARGLLRGVRPLGNTMYQRTSAMGGPPHVPEVTGR